MRRDSWAQGLLAGGVIAIASATVTWFFTRTVPPEEATGNQVVTKQVDPEAQEKALTAAPPPELVRWVEQAFAKLPDGGYVNADSSGQPTEAPRIAEARDRPSQNWSDSQAGTSEGLAKTEKASAPPETSAARPTSTGNGKQAAVGPSSLGAEDAEAQIPRNRNLSWTYLAPVSLKVIAVMYKKILLFDRTLEGEVRLAVVTDEKRQHLVDEVLAAFSAAGLSSQIVRADQIERMAEDRNVACLLPGVANAEVASFTREHRVLTLAIDPNDLKGGRVSFGLGSLDGKPSILINKLRAKREGHDLSVDLLKMASLFDIEDDSAAVTSD